MIAVPLPVVAFADGMSFTETGTSGIEVKMVVVEPGSFVMGSPSKEAGRAQREGPQVTITIERPFAVSETEVSVAQFGRFVETAGYVTDAERSGKGEVFNRRDGLMVHRPGISWREDYKGAEADPELPAIRVSWNDANAFVQWLAKETGQPYRLLTEAEFEYTVRAGTSTPYWWGNGSPQGVIENLAGANERINDLKWPIAFRAYADRHWGPAPVGSFEANPFGVYDMGGNTAEWVADCYTESLANMPPDGSVSTGGDCSLRVFRGAAWSYPPSFARSAYRNAATAGHANASIGFRVALTVSDERLSQVRR